MVVLGAGGVQALDVEKLQLEFIQTYPPTCVQRAIYMHLKRWVIRMNISSIIFCDIFTSDDNPRRSECVAVGTQVGKYGPDRWNVLAAASLTVSANVVALFQLPVMRRYVRLTS